ncbi:hypothetical protein HJFPF1_00606 [Paramyrothecium foliicola]|nr:hypothetical protein HJFPF1_00606 [Paramyrothecium foliicola]
MPASAFPNAGSSQAAHCLIDRKPTSFPSLIDDARHSKTTSHGQVLSSSRQAVETLRPTETDMRFFAADHAKSVKCQVDDQLVVRS